MLGISQPRILTLIASWNWSDILNLEQIRILPWWRPFQGEYTLSLSYIINLLLRADRSGVSNLVSPDFFKNMDKHITKLENSNVKGKFEVLPKWKSSLIALDFKPIPPKNRTMGRMLIRLSGKQVSIIRDINLCNLSLFYIDCLFRSGWWHGTVWSKRAYWLWLFFIVLFLSWWYRPKKYTLKPEKRSCVEIISKCSRRWTTSGLEAINHPRKLPRDRLIKCLLCKYSNIMKTTNKFEPYLFISIYKVSERLTRSLMYLKQNKHMWLCNFQLPQYGHCSKLSFLLLLTYFDIWTPCLCRITLLERRLYYNVFLVVLMIWLNRWSRSNTYCFGAAIKIDSHPISIIPLRLCHIPT